jgi:hypothetical protein
MQYGQVGGMLSMRSLMCVMHGAVVGGVDIHSVIGWLSVYIFFNAEFAGLGVDWLILDAVDAGAE